MKRSPLKSVYDTLSDMLKFIYNMLAAKCILCGEKATQFPHGIPCCEKHACEGDCSSWLGYECDCGKE